MGGITTHKAGIRVLYIFSGLRKQFMGVPSKDYPDTQFYGLHHLSRPGLQAECKELGDFLPGRFAKAVPFRLRHALMFFVARHYDVVFGSSVYHTVFLRRFFRNGTAFVLLNISLTRVIAANGAGSIRGRILRSALRELRAIVCISRAQIKVLKNMLPELSERLHFIPFGVDTVFHQPRFDRRAEYILAAGKDNGRDYATVLEAARSLPDVPFEIICGRRNLSPDIALPQNVRVRYDVSLAEWNKAFLDAKLLLLLTHPDDFSDGSDCSGQTALLQAMACGLPVIASRKQYLDDYVADEREILSVPPYDAQGVVRQIRRLSDERFRMRLAESARKRVETEFSSRTMGDRLAALFLSLAHNHTTS